MAHAIWHIEPSFIGKYWKDKLMGGAMAAQENVMNPLLDRVVGTAPGIPARPWFGGESSGGQPARRPVTSGEAREATKNEMGFLSSLLGRSKPTEGVSKGPPPRVFFGGGMGPSVNQIAGPNRSLVGQGPIPKGTPGVGDKPIGWKWVQDGGQLSLAPDPAGKPVAKPVPVAVNPSQFPGGNQRLGYGADRAASGSYGEAGRSHRGHQTLRRAGQKTGGPLKGPIEEASTPTTEDDKLRRMLKMMFLSDLIRGTEAPNPDYYSAVSVGPASRAFSPLPSMFRGR